MLVLDAGVALLLLSAGEELCDALCEGEPAEGVWLLPLARGELFCEGL